METISIGKYGSFPANLLLGRPYYLTFEILDKEEGRAQTELRVVPASELHAESIASDHATPVESRDEPAEGGVEFDIVGEHDEVIMRSNRLTVDDPSRQTLSMEEIEELKKTGTGSGKEIIAKIMASHMAIDEKTSFSLAKYALRKSKKYLRRFTVLPLDVSMLAHFMLDKEAHRIMELRDEMLGLIGSWANIHCGESSRIVPSADGKGMVGGGRWLVVDDTGGLIVAALAEKMGILYPEEELEDEEEQSEQEQGQKQKKTKDQEQETDAGGDFVIVDAPSSEVVLPPVEALFSDNIQPPNQTSDASVPTSPSKETTSEPLSTKAQSVRKAPRPHIPAMSALTNTLTIIHSNAQPNLGLLKYFSYDASSPTSTHPLFTRLKSLSWLQLLHPSEDLGCVEPEVVSDGVLATWKSGKRGAYYRKRRRWERISRVVQETRAGGFDGLVVASVMEPAAVLRVCVPLLRGAAQVVVYNPTVEPLVGLCDLYSKERKTAFLARQTQPQFSVEPELERLKKEMNQDGGFGEGEYEAVDPDFPVNPTLLLASMLQTARARSWQVLPGRTHPLMTSRGGAEGFLFTATRVLPVEGKVEARGRFRAGKKRKIADVASFA